MDVAGSPLLVDRLPHAGVDGESFEEFFDAKVLGIAPADLGNERSEVIGEGDGFDVVEEEAETLLVEAADHGVGVHGVEGEKVGLGLGCCLLICHLKHIRVGRPGSADLPHVDKEAP